MQSPMKTRFASRSESTRFPSHDYNKCTQLEIYVFPVDHCRKNRWSCLRSRFSPTPRTDFLHILRHCLINLVEFIIHLINILLVQDDTAIVMQKVNQERQNTQAHTNSFIRNHLVHSITRFA